MGGKKILNLIFDLSSYTLAAATAQIVFAITTVRWLKERAEKCDFELDTVFLP